ncbi:hypothetical protein DRO32_02670 [Candidatus Bathyarchaeota archaeon]|nr:MAG: hypothetical protein DRO32_02670 [Candidatus Bathyarchaeota archaeon]
MIRAVVFDLDGTLVHFDLDYAALKSEIIAALARLGIPTSTFSPQDTLTDLLDKVEAYIKASGLNKGEVKKIWNEVFRVAEQFERASVETARLMPGAADVLAALREKGLKIGLLTLNSSAVAMNVLGRLGIKKFFDVLVARDFVEEVKPNPGHLSRVLEELGVRPEEAIVVGDTVFDIRCAKKVGAIAIGITTGRSSEEELRKAGADYVISSLTQLPALLLEIS